MKSISRFIGTTILGGVLFLTPIVALALVLNKAYVWAQRGLQPVATLIPDRFASAPTMTAILTVLVLAFACFLAGLLAKTLLAQRIVGGLETAVLSKVPGYEYMKQAGTSVLGFGEMDEHPLVLVRIGELVAHRRSDGRRPERLRRGVHPQFPQPDVWLRVSRPFRSRSPRERARSPPRSHASGDAGSAQLHSLRPAGLFDDPFRRRQMRPTWPHFCFPLPAQF